MQHRLTISVYTICELGGTGWETSTMYYYMHNYVYELLNKTVFERSAWSVYVWLVLVKLGLADFLAKFGDKIDRNPTIKFLIEKFQCWNQDFGPKHKPKQKQKLKQRKRQR